MACLKSIHTEYVCCWMEEELAFDWDEANVAHIAA